jgi:DnaJ-class molecular chaperone
MRSYFNVHNTPSENQKLYKTLCKQLHPDMPNGDGAAFIEMKKQYDLMVELQSDKGNVDTIYIRAKNRRQQAGPSEFEKAIADFAKEINDNNELIKKRVTERINNLTAKKTDDLFDVIVNILKGKI